MKTTWGLLRCELNHTHTQDGVCVPVERKRSKIWILTCWRGIAKMSPDFRQTEGPKLSLLSQRLWPLIYLLELSVQPATPASSRGVNPWSTLHKSLLSGGSTCVVRGQVGLGFLSSLISCPDLADFHWFVKLTLTPDVYFFSVKSLKLLDDLRSEETNSWEHAKLRLCLVSIDTQETKASPVSSASTAPGRDWNPLA